jgi:hypothetical protein
MSVESYHAKTRAQIEDRGYYIQMVPYGDDTPPLVYSVGLSFAGVPSYPEIAVCGMRPEQCLDLVGAIIDAMQTGRLALDGPVICGNIVEGLDVALRPLACESVQDKLGAINTFSNGASNRAYQMFYPDRAGKFGWDPGCDPQYAKLQGGYLEVEGDTPVNRVDLSAGPRPN